MSKSIFWNNSSELIGRVLRHNVHRCHLETGDKLHTVERDWDAVPVLDILSYEFEKEFWFCRCALVISKSKLLILVFYSLLISSKGLLLPH